MQEKIQVMKKHSEFVEFVSIPQKLHPFKNPHRLPTEPMGIHTVPIPIPYPYLWESPWESPYPRQPWYIAAIDINGARKKKQKNKDFDVYSLIGFYECFTESI